MRDIERYRQRDIERYSQRGRMLLPHPKGDWVRYSKYATLRQKLEAAERGAESEAESGWEAKDRITALEAENARLKEVLVEAREALAWSYQVCDYPANGQSTQDDAIRTIDAALASGGEK